MYDDVPAVGPGHLVGGRYRLQECLGSGAMGAVWRAADELLGRDVAVKQLLTRAGIDEHGVAVARRRALREGRIAARLNHPHAVTMHDVVVDGDDPWLVMELLPARSLAAVLRDRGALGWREVARIGVQVADALTAAHAVGVVHRDVKPANVLLVEAGPQAGTVKLTDFGISRAQGDVVVTATGLVQGTPAYFAPETARGHEPGEASDVYALGATLHACVEGTPPFGLDDNPIALLRRVARGEPARAEHAGAMAGVLAALLAPDPADRPDAARARAQLAAVLGDAPAGAAAEPTEALPRPDAPAAVSATSPTVTVAPEQPAATTVAVPPEAPRSPARAWSAAPEPVLTRPAPPAPDRAPARRGVPRLALVLAALVVLVGVAVAVFLLLGGGAQAAGPGPSTTTTTAHDDGSRT